MTEIKIQRLVKWKGFFVFVECCIYLRRPGWKVVEMVLEPGVDFFYVADSDGAAGGGAEGVVAVGGEVDAVFEGLPFGKGEEGAEAAVP